MIFSVFISNLINDIGQMTFLLISENPKIMNEIKKHKKISVTFSVSPLILGGCLTGVISTVYTLFCLFQGTCNSAQESNKLNMSNI